MSIGKKKTNDDFLIELKEKNDYVMSLDSYVNARTKIRFQCKTCGYIFKTTPDSVLRGSTCAKCKGILKKSHSEFVDELRGVNGNIQVIDIYQNNRTKLLCKCNRCGYEFRKTPCDLLRGQGCPKCYHRSTSFVEQCIYILMCDIFGSENVLSRDTKTIGKELDIYVPKQKIAIEYGSWFWHNNKIDNDFEKLKLCNNKDINIIIIYDSYDAEPILNSHFITIINNISKDYNAVIKLLNDILQYFSIVYEVNTCNFASIKKRAYENSSRKNTDDFCLEIKDIHPNIVVLSDYETAKTPIECKCAICNCIWTPTPDNLLRGQGCPACGKKSTLSFDDFIQSLGDKLNPNVNIVKESYVNTHTKVDCSCNVCGFNWQVLPTDLRHGSGCPKCGGTMQKTHNEFINEMKLLNYNVEILGTYINHKTPILTKCTICGHIWSPRPKHLLKGHLCPKCGGTMKRTIDDMQQELEELSYDITIIGEYVNSDTPIKFRCNKCNCEWEQIYRNLKKSRGCPQCYPYTITQDSIWMKRYDMVKTYYEQYGNIDISARTVIDGIRIGSWLHTQRRCYWNDQLPQEQQNKSLGHISQYRIDLLNELHMKW